MVYWKVRPTDGHPRCRQLPGFRLQDPKYAPAWSRPMRLRLKTVSLPRPTYRRWTKPDCQVFTPHCGMGFGCPSERRQPSLPSSIPLWWMRSRTRACVPVLPILGRRFSHATSRRRKLSVRFKRVASDRIAPKPRARKPATRQSRSGQEIDDAGADPRRGFSAAGGCFYEAATDVVAWQPDEARSS